jgi:hypothetical protein
VRVVRLYNLGPRMARLASCPFLARVAQLDLRGNLVRAADARALAASPYLTGLVELHLTGTTAGGAAARALAGSPGLPSLRRLLLPGATLTPDDARAVADSPYLAGLDLLDVQYGRTGPAAREVLGGRFGDRVRV